MSSPRVTAIIVTWNGRALIGDCLSGILASEPAPDVMVVDNASADGTADFVRENFPQVRVVETGQNLGYGQGCNFGMRLALKDGVDFLLLVNQDARLEKGAIERLVQAAVNHPEMGILMPLNLTSDGRQVDPEFASCLTDPRLKHYHEDLAVGRLKDAYPAGLLPGAVKLLRRETLEEVGAYDPIFFMHGVEYDYHLRAEYHGWQAGLVPQATIYHSYAEHRAQGQPRLSVRQRATKLTWVSYLSLKRVDRVFPVNLSVAYGRLALELFRSLARLDASSAAACLTAVGRVSIAIPRIWRHRQMSYRGGGVFL